MTAPPNSARERPRGRARALLATARARQWVKNLLVLAAPASAGRLGHGALDARLAVAFAAFCLVSSAMYFENDVADAPLDRHHPTKRYRPVAAGELPVALAHAASATLLVAGLALALLLARPGGLLIVLGLYTILTYAYLKGAKQWPILDLVLVASGYVLRAIAGASVAATPPSGWFLAVVSAAALFLVLAKRVNEQKLPDAPASRPVLARYSPRALRAGLLATGGLLVAAYASWALIPLDAASSPLHRHAWFVRASVVPVAAITGRVAARALAPGQADPEDLFARDATLQVLVAAVVACFALALYA